MSYDPYQETRQAPPPPHRAPSRPGRQPAYVRRHVVFIVGGVVGVVALIFGAAIGASGSKPAASASPQATVTVTEKARAVSAPAASSTSKATPSAVRKLVMPHLVGKNGAVATNQLIALGVSQDAITYGSADPNAKMVLLPQDWRVVQQDPKPGAKITAGTPVVLTMVKLSS